jgi:hypothetical protein
MRITGIDMMTYTKNPVDLKPQQMTSLVLTGTDFLDMPVDTLKSRYGSELKRVGQKQKFAASMNGNLYRDTQKLAEDKTLKSMTLEQRITHKQTEMEKRKGIVGEIVDIAKEGSRSGDMPGWEPRSTKG